MSKFSKNLCILLALAFTHTQEDTQQEKTSSIPIHNAQELTLIGTAAYPLDGVYHLADDIDMRQLATQQPKQDFLPIGSVSKAAFRGKLDGRGKTIRYLRINSQQDNVGLFWMLGQEACVENICFENAQVQGHDNVGIVAGCNQGRIKQVQLGHGPASCLVISGNECVGSLVGTNEGKIIKIRATGTVTGYAFVGGLVGKNSGKIKKVETQSTVTGYEIVGGLAGKNSGKIVQGIVAGRVTGALKIHPLVGENKGTTTLCLSGSVEKYQLEPDSEQALSLKPIQEVDRTDAEEQL